MIIRAIRLRAITEKGEFGFFFEFARTLTIIRGSNSSGKSTLVNCLLYALGMEEIIGGRDERVLPYAVKDYFEYEEERISIAASEVFLEIENSTGEVITLRRSIRDEGRSSKLVEIFKAAYLTGGTELGVAIPTYLHDSGGASRQEGFHRYLETFFGLNLPQVATTKGGETKLYLQAIFAALAVEQKRGWTDYIANIPFYSIRDARIRVVEYLLGLSVFETNARRNRLDAEAVEIDAHWREIANEFRREADNAKVIIEGLSPKPNALFDSDLVQMQKLVESSSVISLHDYISQLRNEYASLNQQMELNNRSTGAERLQEIEVLTEEVQRLSVLHERATTTLELQRSSLREHERLLEETKEDRARNKTAKKLQGFGARNEVELAFGRCPTCHQKVEHTLFSEDIYGPQMDLETNIRYLESQCRMLQRQITGLHEANRQSERNVADLANRLATKHDYLAALRGDVSSGATESRAIAKRQIQIEIEIEGLEDLECRALTWLNQLKGVATRLVNHQLERKKLPKNNYTVDDEARIARFEMYFKDNARVFGYESAAIKDIEINRDALVPSLSQLELRQIFRTDIKSDSSASDFVRLIWSYLIALYKTSAHANTPGAHPGLLLLDEPGQHSMRVESQHALLICLAAEQSLQSIIAASFDEAEPVFQAATDGVVYKLIQWSGKLIRPLAI